MIRLHSQLFCRVQSLPILLFKVVRRLLCCICHHQGVRWDRPVALKVSLKIPWWSSLNFDKLPVNRCLFSVGLTLVAYNSASKGKGKPPVLLFPVLGSRLSGYCCAIAVRLLLFLLPGVLMTFPRLSFVAVVVLLIFYLKLSGDRGLERGERGGFGQQEPTGTCDIST